MQKKFRIKVSLIILFSTFLLLAGCGEKAEKLENNRISLQDTALEMVLNKNSVTKIFDVDLLKTEKALVKEVKEEVLPYAAQKKKGDSNKYRCVAYYTSWSAYAREVQIKDIDASLLTHINFAFANVKYTGEVIVGDPWVDTEKPMGSDTWETKGIKGHFGQLAQLKAKNPGLKTLISVGGWTWSDQFSDIAASSKKRKKFAQSAVKFIKKYGFDGIDIDWEYPVEGGDGIKHRKADKENYTKLLAEVRKALDAQGRRDKRTYLLTIAGGANTSFVRNIEMKKIVNYVDFINIMAYDYHGGWETSTNHNAPLYINPKDPGANQGLSIENTINSYMKAGAPAKLLNLGLAFYGRGWSNVSSGKNKGLFSEGVCPAGTGYGLGTWEGGVFDYWDLKQNYINKKGYKRYYDKSAEVPYLYNGSVFISYDDIVSITKKLNFMKKKNLGGVMLWELSGDKKKELQKVIASSLALNGRKNSASQTADQQEPAVKTPSPTKVPVSDIKAVQWKKSEVYTAGDIVVYKKVKYKAKWWTQGERPDASAEWGPWERM